MEPVEELTTERINNIMLEMNKWAHNCETLREQMEGTAGETKIAYSAVYNDYLWKLKLTTQRLWYYLAGCQELNPFEPKPTPSFSELTPAQFSSLLQPLASND